MLFEIGEKVTFLYESGWGMVQKFMPNQQVLVKDETGFDRLIPLSELVKIHGDQRKGLNDVTANLSTKDGDETQTVKSFEDTRRLSDMWELDLHIHELLESEKGMTNADMLLHQLKVFKNFYKQARSQRVRKLVVIHGVGKGILKDEVRAYLGAQEALEFFDADFREYGKGATEVQLFYN
jgi:DNA-nicking Smr family endonuclease